MYNTNTLLNVFFNKEEEIALEKQAHNTSLLFGFYVLLVSSVYTLYSAPPAE